MTVDQAQLAELRLICPDAEVMSEASYEFIFLPALRMPDGAPKSEMKALLCPKEHPGYPTRLFLEQPVLGRVTAWTEHVILSEKWFTWSWKDIPASLRLTQILAQHMRGLS